MINIGTVMEIFKNEVLVMTIDFELVRVKRTSDMFLGLQVSFRKSDVIRPETRKLKFLASGIAAVFMVAFIAIYILQNTGLSPLNTGYAFIDMDINPSIGFLIDDTNTVKKVLPLNSDAENLTQLLSLKNLPVEEAVKKVIDRSQEMGLVNPNEDNVIMISASLNPDNSDYKVRRDNVEHNLNQLLTSLKAIDNTELNNRYSIKVVKVEPEIKKQAIKNGLSAGRQLILEKAQAEGIDLTLDEVKSDSLSELMKKVIIDDQNNDEVPLSSPIALPSEKVTSAVNPTPAKETATPAQTSSPTPVPTTESIKPTNTKTPDVSASITPAPTITPVVSASITPAAKTPAISADSIKIQYYNVSKKAADVIQINAVFKVINTGNTIINLNDITLRYYYTINSERPQLLDCWAQSDKTNINYKFVKMSKPVEKADYYLELGFKSGQLNPSEATEIVVWFNKDDWSTYNQDDDYSYNSSDIQNYYDWNYVTGYVSGSLKWGIEPVN